MAFGSTYPNYDVSALSEQVCARQGWKLAKVRLHTGIPDVGDHARWHFFWTHKLVAMGRRGVVVYSRPLRNRNRKVVLPDGTNLRFARLAQVARTLGPEGGRTGRR